MFSSLKNSGNLKSSLKSRKSIILFQTFFLYFLLHTRRNKHFYFREKTTIYEQQSRIIFICLHFLNPFKATQSSKSWLDKKKERCARVSWMEKWEIKSGEKTPLRGEYYNFVEIIVDRSGSTGLSFFSSFWRDIKWRRCMASVFIFFFLSQENDTRVFFIDFFGNEKFLYRKKSQLD